ncbi:type II secretion system F family protein [Gordonia phthalatica]|uniref:Pilus assembly protein TadC n=1 Tax=Gordonia phthalatica TaxID=1136941 RepID=A0A0N9N0C6_9ACTN|nr:type II secretion system F family protein [Gordonia phthalatica]ALG83514.1 pilus assembly protein TadC [Gordonia phthalatica]
MTLVLILAAAAVIAWPPPDWVLQRVVGSSGPQGQEPEGAGDPDPFDLAAGYDTLAVCLRAGLPVATAAQVAAHASPPTLGRSFLRAADLLALGSDPERAWAAHRSDDDDFADLAALIRRASRAGAALAEAISGFADGTRRRAENEALEAAERAGVKISGPLGLCFLPAFVCLGIVPVVIGLASDLLVGL